MVVDGLRTQCTDQFVEHRRAHALERSVGGSLPAHAEDNFGACVVSVDHLLDGVDVILEIGIDAHQGIPFGRI